MKKLFVLSMTVVAMGLVADQADAFGRRGRRCDTPCYSAPACGYTVKYVNKTVTSYRPVWKTVTEKVKCHRVIYKNYTVKEKVKVCKVEYKDVKQKVVRYKTVTDWVTREVTHCEMVPKTVMRIVRECRYVWDPCTCTCKPCYTTRKVAVTVCCPKYTKRKVKCPVYKCVAYDDWVTVRQCNYVWEDKEVDVVRCKAHTVVETVPVTRHVCSWEKCTQTVRVRVCVPCPTTCADPCAPSGPRRMPRAY